jgi:hypothetical protein
VEAERQSSRHPEDGRTFQEQWRASLPGHLAQASDFERGLIADGIVTIDEHEQAVIAFLACQRDTYTVVREGYKATNFDPDGTEAGQLRNIAQSMSDAGIHEIPDGATMERINDVVDRIRANGLDQREADRIFATCGAKTVW